MFCMSYHVELITPQGVSRGTIGVGDMSANEGKGVPAVRAIAEGSGPARVHPLMLHVRPVCDGVAQAREDVGWMLEAGVAGIVFPRVESATNAAVAVPVMGEASWPVLPNMLMAEARAGVERVGETANTAGASAPSVGPGDLRHPTPRTRRPSQTLLKVLRPCGDHGAACGIIAGGDDIEDRIAQGCCVFVVGDPAAVVDMRGWGPGTEGHRVRDGNLGDGVTFCARPSSLPSSSRFPNATSPADPQHVGPTSRPHAGACSPLHPGR